MKLWSPSINRLEVDRSTIRRCTRFVNPILFSPLFFHARFEQWWRNSHSRGCIRNEHLPRSTFLPPLRFLLLAFLSSREIFLSPFFPFSNSLPEVLLYKWVLWINIVMNRGEIFTRFSTRRSETRDSRWNKSFCERNRFIKSRTPFSSLFSYSLCHSSIIRSNALHQGF